MGDPNAKGDKKIHFPYDGCKHVYCRDCDNISTTEQRCLTLSSKILKFYCSKCPDIHENSRIDDLISANRKLKRELESLKKVNQELMDQKQKSQKQPQEMKLNMENNTLKKTNHILES
ncbi:hypothetical protein HHI36_018182 [Cryptolaemus montrouzieri]|uniref:Uncharacterized protein n=1 Tax=Cryptolaemus montrouzieri TaxID=559131 RepID=A0ABD2NZD9_9CUCU